MDFGFWILDWAKRTFGIRRSAFGVAEPAGPRNPKSKIQNPKFAAFAVLLAAILLAAPLSARSPEEADRLYHEIGAQLFCICGCRENLLTCSMNVCSSKVLERDLLRSLTADAMLDSAAIKDRMVERFGPQVLQVPPDSHIYPIIGVAVLLLAGAFGFGFWSITRRSAPASEAAGTATLRDDLDARIERELKELE